MDLQAHLSVLANHPFSVVFWASLIEAAGIPFPSRVILILTPAFLATETDLVRLIIVATIGALLGDHVPYIAGRVAGTRVLGLYCKVTLGSAHCVERTLEYFRRFGAAALVFSRFSTSVRIFASACAGCGRITYLRYIAFDTIGTVVYTTLCVLVGYWIGERLMVASLTFHLIELEQRVAVLQLSVQGLRATYAADATARADFDAVVHDATKLRSHLQGVRIEVEYSKGGSV
jgi:membrane protein DedA with SNARE-associated domain